jgi:phosphate-selective porin OprO/OprP
VVLEGTVFKYFDLFVMPDFAEGTTVLQDAYVGANFWQFARLRVGKFKEPVSLERLQVDHNVIFVERAFPTSLAPNRDVGAQVFGELGQGVFSYALGIFNGEADNAISESDSGDDKDFAGRVFAHPLKKSEIEALKGLGFGVAGTYGNQFGTNPTYKTAGQNTFFTLTAGTGASPASPSVKVDGSHWRISPQGYYYFRRFGLLAEYIVSGQEVRRDVTGQASTFDEMRNRAWQVAGSVLLTDDEATFAGVSPRKPFDLRSGQWGAFELAARYSELDVDDDAFSGGFANPAVSASMARAWAVGFNWYLNRNVKWIIDFERTQFEGGAAGGKDRETENAILTRIQIYF